MMLVSNRPEQDDDAAVWVARQLSGDHRSHADDDVADWKAESPENAEAFEELMAMANSLDAVAEAALEAEMVAELEAAAEERKRTRWMAGLSSVAAGLVVAAIMTVSLWVTPVEPRIYETVKGQRSSIALEDGSVMHLNTDTKVVAVLEEGARHVTITRGEALFDVKRDEDRPFYVEAGKTEVKVLGTKFNVRLGASSNIVSVLSGLVSVSHRNDGPEEKAQEIALLHAGEQADHDPLLRTASIAAFDQDAIIAWRTGKAVYHEAKLAAVVADLNRYFDAPLEIADSDLSDLPVTGTFNLSDQTVVIDALESAFSLMAVERVDGTVLLYRAE